jgi:hypothetical protein
MDVKKGKATMRNIKLENQVIPETDANFCLCSQVDELIVVREDLKGMPNPLRATIEWVNMDILLNIKDKV